MGLSQCQASLRMTGFLGPMMPVVVGHRVRTTRCCRVASFRHKKGLRSRRFACLSGAHNRGMSAQTFWSATTTFMVVRDSSRMRPKPPSTTRTLPTCEALK